VSGAPSAAGTELASCIAEPLERLGANTLFPLFLSPFRSTTDLPIRTWIHVR
jgi:hypothetical protein